MAAQMGGLSRNARANTLVQRVGTQLASRSIAARSSYRFSLHVLADSRTVNAFALPGGPVFITAAESGYDPRAMIRVMEVLAQASGGSRQPEFMSTHPAPENREARIKEQIAKQFPQGIPEGLAR